MQDEKKKASSVLITTSHNPTHFLRRVCRLLSYSIPLSTKINRGSLSKNDLLNYCWNNRIRRLFVVQQSQEINVINLECLNLAVSTEPFKASIELRGFSFPQKGDNQTRISVNNIEFHYSKEIPKNLRRKIHSFIEVFLESNYNNQKSNILFVYFLKYEKQILNGEVTFNRRNLFHPLFRFKVVFPMVDE